MKAVIFDMDGVIIDSHSAAYELLHDAASSFGCQLTIEEIKSWGSLSSRQFWHIVKDRFNLSVPMDELLSSYKVDKEIEMYKQIGMITGALDLLQMLKRNKIKIALATSASKKRMDAVLDMFRIRAYFDACICDDDVKHSKPDPEIFLAAANQLAVEPRCCIVIEDSNNGLNAAKSAAMRCIGFKGLSHVRENMEGADWIIHAYDEINMMRLTELWDGLSTEE
ncbi:HAD family phosphatase [Paenibacillus sp. PR3]|uniref:HAD family phosphatase n=1 Tax=Paenibacillus terricola TaxID=2763503 RepID=A0ABR8N5X5_9BACL|nr:HAD family phosphatase [Paenibacillus terricola]MBD3922951.1 HAD family phosphatase [Paenibacillus terricola]